MAFFMPKFGPPNYRRVGASAIVLDCGESTGAIQSRLGRIAHDGRAWRGVREAVAAAGNLTLLFDRTSTDFDTLEAQLDAAWTREAEDTAAARVVEIPVCYGGGDGPDLEDVAAACALACEEVIALHARAQYTVAFVGFLPGFAYLDGLDARLQQPRRAQPRTRVPRGSVAVAGNQSAIYPFDSPGGWHLIGRTDLAMFDPRREPAALLQPGDRVRFIPQ